MKHLVYSVRYFVVTINPPIRHAFFCPAYYDIRKSIYLGYNYISSHRYQYNLPRSGLFSELYRLYSHGKVRLLTFSGSYIISRLTTTYIRAFTSDITTFPVIRSSITFQEADCFQNSSVSTPTGR